ncbi:MAG: hypothetical protein ACLQBL_00370, partial [Polyangiaceae bacterium]
GGVSNGAPEDPMRKTSAPKGAALSFHAPPSPPATPAGRGAGGVGYAKGAPTALIDVRGW